MILANGTVYDSSEQDKILEVLEEEINDTLEKEALTREQVISAVHRLREKIAAGEFTDLIRELLPEHTEHYLGLVTKLMSEESLRYRVRLELGEDDREVWEIEPPYKNGMGRVFEGYAPLGTLFHIAAGNMDGLPAFSVIEGLLTGNVNILKLPQADKGLTIEIFRQMIEIEPLLARYIYVFDTPSTDIAAMKKMADISDGIVTWGGDEAIRAVRMLAGTGAKLIEWGHRLGFAYISGYEDKNAELEALAKHIVDTRQLLCSSCQTIYIDTGEMGEIYQFCEEFLPFLEAAAEENPVREVGAVAEISLRRYAKRLDDILGEIQEQRIFQGKGCSVTACADSRLELSYMYGNVLVKPLPQGELLGVLRKAKGYLQTAGLICARDKRKKLTDLLIRSGVTRVMTAGNMSVSFCGEAHDGEYPLRRYVKVVNVEEGLP